LPLDIFNWKSSPWTPEAPSQMKSEEELKGNLMKGSHAVVLFKSPTKRLNKIESDRKIGRERKKKLQEKAEELVITQTSKKANSSDEGRLGKKGERAMEEFPQYDQREDGEHERKEEGEQREKEKGKEKVIISEPEITRPPQEESPPHNERYGVGGLGPAARRGNNARDDYIHKFEDGSWSPKIFIGTRKTPDDDKHV